ncbi:DUF3021 domain-containing protein [Secundilactobacillus muriivasis]
MMKWLTRLVSGGVVGIAVGFMMALAFSAGYGTDIFMPSSPDFVAGFRSNLWATVASTGLWFLMGVVFSGSAVVFESERLSIVQQTSIHAGLTFLLFTPLALLAGWFPLKVMWLLSYTFEFMLIYVALWCLFMWQAKRRVRQLNRLIAEKRE